MSQPIRTRYPRLENLTVVVAVVVVAVVVGIPHSSGHWLAIASKNKELEYYRLEQLIFFLPNCHAQNF